MDTSGVHRNMILYPHVLANGYGHPHNNLYCVYKWRIFVLVFCSKFRYKINCLFVRPPVFITCNYLLMNIKDTYTMVNTLVIC